jgi:glutamate dehydrogenase/leucine dehydrogenase
MGWKGCRIAIEGFGKVGSIVADMACCKGALIIGTSNSRGAVIDEHGLDVSSLIRQRKEQGSSFITGLGGSCGKNDLFSADCDVFVPCAHCLSIDESNASSIKAEIIISGANVPMTSATERELWNKGKLIIPDSVANCGGVVGTMLTRYLDDKRISHLFDSRLKSRIQVIFDSRMLPSDFIDGFCKKRREVLSKELEPKPILNLWKERVKYHLAEPLFGSGDVETSLFPA